MRTIAIVLPIVVFAFAMGYVFSSDGSVNTLFAAPAAQEDSKVGFLGHVELIHKNAAGDTIGYYQMDNLVHDDGNDCLAIAGFDSDNTLSGTTCTAFGEFDFIGVGDAICTACEDETLQVLKNEITTGGTDALRRQDTAVAGFSSSVSGAGTTVIINTETPFTFTTGGGNVSNNIFDVALFDAATGGNMFALRNASSTLPNPGIDVNDGDTLDVTWTITVG